MKRRIPAVRFAKHAPALYTLLATLALTLSLSGYLRTRSRALAYFGTASAERALVQRYRTGLNHVQSDRRGLLRRLLNASDPLGAAAELAKRVALTTDQLSVPPDVTPANEGLVGADSADRVAVRISLQSDTPQLIGILERLVNDSISLRLDALRIVAPSPVGDTATSLGLLDVTMTVSALRRSAHP